MARDRNALASETADRDLFEAQADMRYAARAHQLCEAYYERWNIYLIVVQGLFTAGAVVTITKQYPTLSAIVGILVAGMQVIQTATKPLGCAAKHQQAKLKFEKSIADLGASKDLDAWETSFAKADVGNPVIPKWISYVAYNDNLKSLGRYDSCVNETRWEKLRRQFFL